MDDLQQAADDLEILIERMGWRDRRASWKPRLVVDENLQMLVAPLRAKGYKVDVPTPGMSDEDIQEKILPHKVLITRNTKDFATDAAYFEYSILALENLHYIDSDPNPDKNQTVRLILKAMQAHSVPAQNRSFILILHEQDPRRPKTSPHDFVPLD